MSCILFTYVPVGTYWNLVGTKGSQVKLLPLKIVFIVSLYANDIKKNDNDIKIFVNKTDSEVLTNTRC